MNDIIVSALLIAASDVRLGAGRLLPAVAVLVGLVGAVIGGLALRRSRHSVNVRASAIVATVLGSVGLATGGLHAANSAGGFGTGNGLAGAIVAIAVGSIGVLLGGLALTRPRRPTPQGAKAHVID